MRKELLRLLPRLLQHFLCVGEEKAEAVTCFCCLEDRSWEQFSDVTTFSHLTTQQRYEILERNSSLLSQDTKFLNINHQWAWTGWWKASSVLCAWCLIKALIIFDCIVCSAIVIGYSVQSQSRGLWLIVPRHRPWSSQAGSPSASCMFNSGPQMEE